MFGDVEFIDIRSIVDMDVDVKDVKVFSNNSGDGVAALIDINGEERYICTHSVGLVKALSSEEFRDALLEEPVTITVRGGKSKKTGMLFYYLD